MALYDYNGQLTHTSYFDAEVIAMRTELANGTKPVYHDDKGRFYAYNNDENQYESMVILPSSSMGFMVAGLTTQMYKLPHQPYFDALKALDKVNSGLNFLVLEMAFVYQPEHFGDEYYRPVKVNGNGSGDCTRFVYNDPEYPGSYIQFDEQGRLDEFYINASAEKFKDNPSGKFVGSFGFLVGRAF
jgi:hypothetical protein